MTRAFALLMAAVLALYVLLVGWRAVQLIASGEALGIGVGIALLVIPVVGAWALVTELRFGLRLERLVKRLEADDAMPAPLPATPSGRADKAAADEAFPVAKADVEANQESWASWLRLSMAYDAARDRKRARHAAREAIRLARLGEHDEERHR